MVSGKLELSFRQSFLIVQVLEARKCESNMAGGASFTCPFARLSSCKHFAFGNLIRGVAKFEGVCRRHASNTNSFSGSVFSCNRLPASLHDRRSRLLSLVALRNVHSSPRLWNRSLFRYCCRWVYYLESVFIYFQWRHFHRPVCALVHYVTVLGYYLSLK